MLFLKNSPCRFSKHHIFAVIIIDRHICIFGLVYLEGIELISASDLVKSRLRHGGLLFLYDIRCCELAAFGAQDLIQLFFADLVFLDLHDSLDDLTALGETLGPLDYHLINLIIKNAIASGPILTQIEGKTVS